jgi:hypothetical protein
MRMKGDLWPRPISPAAMIETTTVGTEEPYTHGKFMGLRDGWKS